MPKAGLNNYRRKVLNDKPETGGKLIEYSDPEEEKALSALKNKNDFESLRLKRLLALPDLTRVKNSPIKFIVERILTLSEFKGFDVVKAPETITLENGFDVFNFPPNHPSRNPSDTYFISANRVLRTHTTSMWFYYLTDKEILKKMDKTGWVGELSFGKVYRKDEIDSKHFPVFHQIDGLYIVKNEMKKV